MKPKPLTWGDVEGHYDSETGGLSYRVSRIKKVLGAVDYFWQLFHKSTVVEHLTEKQQEELREMIYSAFPVAKEKTK